jgi:phage anti-repressor protein
MLERSEIGRAIRKAFIAKEKELRGISQLPAHNELFKGLKSAACSR